MSESFGDKFLIFCTIVFFLLLILAAGFLHDDYGGFTDEMMEIETAGINLKFIQARFFPSMSLPDVPTFSWEYLPDLPDYEDKTYGAAAMMPTLFINELPGISLNRAEFLDFRRFYTFINFWLALLCFYGLLQTRFKSRLVSLCGVLLLTLSPRIFAESFYNVKDMVFFSWFLISLCGIGWYLLRRNKWGLVGFCIGFGLSVNVRNFGIILLPAFGTLAVIDCVSTARSNSVRSQVAAYIITIICAIGCYLLVTPGLWENPLVNLREGLFFSAQQTGIGDAELFMGNLIAPKDVWYYLPVWMGITIPVLNILLFGVGIVFLIQTVCRERLTVFSDRTALFDLFIFALFWITFIGIILSHATIYHGWRHCYFLYGPFMITAVYGLERLWKAVSKKKAAATGFLIVLLLSFGTNGLWIVKNHPFDFVYFNEIGRHFAAQFTRDYWGVSSKKCIYDLSSRYEGRALVLGVNPDETWGSDLFSLWRFPDEIQSRFQTVWQNKNADYLCFSYKHTPGNDHEIQGFKRIQTYRVDDFDVAGMYERMNTDSGSSSVSSDQ